MMQKKVSLYFYMTNSNSDAQLVASHYAQLQSQMVKEKKPLQFPFL